MAGTSTSRQLLLLLLHTQAVASTHSREQSMHATAAAPAIAAGRDARQAPQTNRTNTSTTTLAATTTQHPAACPPWHAARPTDKTQASMTLSTAYKVAGRACRGLPCPLLRINCQPPQAVHARSATP